MEPITLFLTCADLKEARKISHALLENRLVACVKTVPVSSDFYWQGKIDSAKEVLLIIDSIAAKFKDIETTVAKLHSYDTPNLMAYPVTNMSVGVREWLQEATNQTNKMTKNKLKLYTDGGARGNPGPAAIAYVICDLNDNVVEKSGKYIGETTNNQAEYQALFMGLQRIKQLGTDTVEVYMDSELVIKQITGLYKIKNNELKPWHAKIVELASGFKTIKFIHVPRALNKEADAEVNRVLDEQAGKN